MYTSTNDTGGPTWLSCGRGSLSAEYYITNSEDIAADSISIFAFRIYCSYCQLRKDLYKYQ